MKFGYLSNKIIPLVLNETVLNIRPTRHFIPVPLILFFMYFEKPVTLMGMDFCIQCLKFTIIIIPCLNPCLAKASLVCTEARISNPGLRYSLQTASIV